MWAGPSQLPPAGRHVAWSLSPSVGGLFHSVGAIESSTGPDPIGLDFQLRVNQVLEDLFSEASREMPEEYEPFRLGAGLDKLIRKYGKAVVREIGRLVASERFSADIRQDALTILGSIGDPPTHKDRVAILTHNLAAKDVCLRDGAASGLANIDDPATISEVLVALEREPSPRLRRKLQLVIDQLREPERWPNILG